MSIKIYKGTIREDVFGYSQSYGYDPSLSLECENGGWIPLGNSRYSSYFSDKVGQRIRLTIEDLGPFGSDEQDGSIDW